MKFIADLHIHSKFSRATAKNADLENLYMAAQRKGITLIGTGDFTHPGWFGELREKLVPAEPGLFRLRDDVAAVCDEAVPSACRRPVRFMLTAEISNIYKKDGRTRKNHNLIFVPDQEKARIFSEKLAKIGNIQSDGRPILGLDARNLLEIVLETDPRSFLVPAHIWTPWFSLLGSKSGFDTIEECFEDLSPHIFALETGLSSDPAMNWRVSALDGRTLISNSDAHSPSKLGREANRFDCDLSFDEIRSTLESGDPQRFLGTLEFYPEEGKYHLDGHRKCGVRLHPRKTLAAGGICPVCQRPLTLGVLYRVEQLADRGEGERPPGVHPYRSLVPLVDILSNIHRVGPGSKKVARAYETALESLGGEMDILTGMDIPRLEGAGIPLLAEAVRRMRDGRIQVNGGFDGQFGTVAIFTDDERDRLMGQHALFFMPGVEETEAAAGTNLPFPAVETPPAVPGAVQATGELNADQSRAVFHDAGPLMIVAGPGTGKTLTLTRRIAHLVREKGVDAHRILAVTFTNKAAREMMQRLENLLPDRFSFPFVDTFHGLCLSLLREAGAASGAAMIDDGDRSAVVADAMDIVLDKGLPAGGSLRTNLDRIVQAKQRLLGPKDDLSPVTPEAGKNGFKGVYETYEALLSLHGLLDFEDLIFKVVRKLETQDNFLSACRERFRYLFVDEYQDLNYGQYRLIRLLAADPQSDLFVIGDPDQAIYGFRGSDRRYFSDFLKDYPRASVIHLTENYRSAGTIIEAAHHVIRSQHEDGTDARVYAQESGGKQVTVLEAETETGEAVAIGKTIESLVGGLAMHALDFGKVGDGGDEDRFGFSDFAVLARTRSQLDAIADRFAAAGIPFQMAARERLFHRRGVAHILSLLKLVSGRGTFADLDRIRSFLRPGISKDSADRFKRWCAENAIAIHNARYSVRQFPVPGLTRKRQQRLYDFLGTLFTLGQAVAPACVTEKIRYLLAQTKVSEAFDDTGDSNLQRLLEMADGAGDDTAGFLAAVSLTGDTDILIPEAEKVSLMTLHAAKGLEFPVVFVCGCEDGILPFARKGNTDEAEERRLFYVALTRAEKELYLTRARHRTVHGRRQAQRVSPFLAELEGLLEKGTDGSVKPKPTAQQQMTLF